MLFRFARWLLWALGWTAQCAAAGFVLVWLVGRVVSDRYEWSQWLLWIPTPALLTAVVLGLVAAWRPATRAVPWHRAVRGRLVRWLIAAVLLGAWFGLIEHHMLRFPGPVAPDKALHLVHWNGAIDLRLKDEATLDAVRERDPDIVILTDAWVLPWRETARSWLGDRGSIAYTHPFAVISQVPILECRSIVASDRIDVVLMRFDASTTLGREIVVYAIDLPSKLSIGRYALATRVRELLGSLDIPPADLIVGDFNITRGSAAMGLLANEMRHAYDLAGGGYAASFPRELPIYHIDHVLCAPGIGVARYELFDPGISRHRAQSVIITPPMPPR